MRKLYLALCPEIPPSQMIWAPQEADQDDMQTRVGNLDRALANSNKRAPGAFLSEAGISNLPKNVSMKDIQP